MAESQLDFVIGIGVSAMCALGVYGVTGRPRLGACCWIAYFLLWIGLMFWDKKREEA